MEMEEDPDFRRRWRIKMIELEVLKRGMIG
jgi:hypothetical protein